MWTAIIPLSFNYSKILKNLKNVFRLALFVGRYLARLVFFVMNINVVIKYKYYHRIESCQYSASYCLEGLLSDQTRPDILTEVSSGFPKSLVEEVWDRAPNHTMTASLHIPNSLHSNPVSQHYIIM
jgi:hypothetical protein